MKYAIGMVAAISKFVARFGAGRFAGAFSNVIGIAGTASPQCAAGPAQKQPKTP